MGQDASASKHTEQTSARLNPRTRRVKQVVLDAAVEVLLADGAEQVTAAHVAARADVARTTVYRHWPDQASLLLATIDTLVAPHHPPPGTGVLDSDLRSALENLRMRLVKNASRQVFGALASRSHQDQAFANAQRRFVEQLAQPVVAVLERARERGDVEASLDCRFEAELLAGPVLHRHLVLHAEVPDRLIDTVVARWQNSASAGSGVSADDDRGAIAP